MFSSFSFELKRQSKKIATHLIENTKSAFCLPSRKLVVPLVSQCTQLNWPFWVCLPPLKMTLVPKVHKRNLMKIMQMQCMSTPIFLKMNLKIKCRKKWYLAFVKWFDTRSISKQVSQSLAVGLNCSDTVKLIFKGLFRLKRFKCI